MTVVPFRPPVWLPGGHLQTLWRKFANPVKSLERQRQRIDLSDGDFVDLDWLMAAGSPPPGLAQTAGVFVAWTRRQQ